MLAKIKSLLNKLINRGGELREIRHRHSAAYFLLVRNGLVLVSAVLFIIGLFHIPHRFLLKGIAYVAGAGAYLCEYLILTDSLTKKPPVREKFMIYLFGPLYLIMALSYFIEHLNI